MTSETKRIIDILFEKDQKSHITNLFKRYLGKDSCTFYIIEKATELEQYDFLVELVDIAEDNKSLEDEQRKELQKTTPKPKKRESKKIKEADFNERHLDTITYKGKKLPYNKAQWAKMSDEERELVYEQKCESENSDYCRSKE